MKKTILNPLLALACLLSPSLQAQPATNWTFNYTGSITNWTAPRNGVYTITALGAAGGTSLYGAWLGQGAMAGGSFSFLSGFQLNILSGGSGASGTTTSHGGGGGGGSFVVDFSSNPLVVAGGGGGGAYSLPYGGAPGNPTGFSGWDASTNTSGTSSSLHTLAGTNGGGGHIVYASDLADAGGGAGGGLGGAGGFYQNADGSFYIAGGTSYFPGGPGGGSGAVVVGSSGYPLGGFGGGGQAGAYSGGGGGGYSGGAGGYFTNIPNGGLISPGGWYEGAPGGGGGSYVASSASNTFISIGNTGSGSVSIAQVVTNLVVGDNTSGQSDAFTNGSSLYLNVALGVNAGDSNNSISVANAGTVLSALTNVVVGVAGSGNSLSVTDHGAVVSYGSGMIGLEAAASNNTAVVTGSGSTWSNTGDLTVGYYGSGNSLLISNGGIASNLGQDDGSAVIGVGTNSTGNSATVTGSGSAWHSGNDLVIGYSGSGNSLVVTNGGTVSNGVSSYPGSLYGGIIGYNAGANSNSALVTGSDSRWTSSGDLFVGFNGSGNSMVISNGGSISNAQVNYGGVLGASAASSNNSVSVTGSGSAWNSSGDLVVGVSGSGNSMTVSDGASVVNGQVTNGAVVGLNANSTGNSVLVTGSGSSWNNDGSLTVGMSGSGNSLVVSNGAIVNGAIVDDLGGVLGYNAGSSNNSGLVTGPGSSWNIYEASITVGNGGSGNSLVVSNGGHVNTMNTYISYGAGAADNSVVVTGPGSTLSNGTKMLVGVSGSGGSLVVSDGATIRSFIGQLGYNAGSSNNSALVTGSGSVWNNPNSYNGITVGVSGGATLTVANGGEVNLNSTGITLGLTLAEYAGSSGTLNIGRFGTNDAAGTVSTPKIGFGAGTGTINFNQSNSTTINAVISGHGSVNQLGSGTTILTGNYTPGGNTYSGTTTVSAGTLLASSASGSSAIGSSTLMVNNTGTFGGKGVVQGAATIASGGTLAVGLDGVGSLSFNGGLTLEAGSTTIFQVHATDDFTSVYLSGGRVTYGGALVFSLVDFTPVAGDEFEVFNLIGASESGNFSSVEVGGSDLSSELNGLWSGMNAGVTYQFNVTTGILTVQTIPEPSTYALLGLGAVAFGAHVLRRRRRV